MRRLEANEFSVLQPSQGPQEHAPQEKEIS